MTAPQHTKEPWRIELGVIIGADDIELGALDGHENYERCQIDKVRIVACVNGCAGLNPAAYRECVEALKRTVEYAAYNPELEDEFSWVKHAKQALAHAEAKP